MGEGGLAVPRLAERESSVVLPRALARSAGDDPRAGQVGERNQRSAFVNASPHAPHHRMLRIMVPMATVADFLEPRSFPNPVPKDTTCQACEEVGGVTGGSDQGTR